jgi:hypothetical protein
MRAVVVDLTEGHLLGVDKLGLVFSFFLRAVTVAVGAATVPEPERDRCWPLSLVDVGSLKAVAAGGGDGTGGGALRPDAGVSGSADEGSGASIGTAARRRVTCRRESSELTVLKAIEELRTEALS